MNRLGKALVAFAIVLAIAGVAAIVLARPEAREPVWTATRENTAIFEALVAQGIPDALVDATAERALVRYDVPDGMPRDDAMWRALGALAATSDAAAYVLQVTDEGRAIEEIRVASADVRALLQGQITREEFDGRMERAAAGQR